MLSSYGETSVGNVIQFRSLVVFIKKKLDNTKTNGAYGNAHSVRLVSRFSLKLEIVKLGGLCERG